MCQVEVSLDPGSEGYKAVYQDFLFCVRMGPRAHGGKIMTVITNICAASDNLQSTSLTVISLHLERR